VSRTGRCARRAGTALGLLLAGAGLGCDWGQQSLAQPTPAEVSTLVRMHAQAWERGDTSILGQILHEDAEFAYPRRRIGRSTWAKELDAFSRTHRDTRIYLHHILAQDSTFAVEWQFASTDASTGVRTAVSDAIIGRVRDGRIVLWKEYLDGRVPELQRDGKLSLEEGENPYPWPRPPASKPRLGTS